MPPDPEPAIPGDQEVILYLHGHSSRLEEAMELTGRIHEAAARAGRTYTVISLDLPCCGYASHLDHERIAPPEASRYHLSGDGGGYPILDFIEEFVVRFVETLDRRVGVRGRIAAVVGGSLGGNLVLRLGERRPAPPWLRALVSWSPASVWDALVYDAIKDRVTEVPRGEMVEPETEDRRREYFGNVFEGFFHLVAVGPQWESWWREDWPCRRAYADGARHDRREIYTPAFRRWHWRVALEQLLFSHRSPARADGPPLYRSIRNRLLLVAGEEDDDQTLEIHDASLSMARQMPDTPGEAVFLRDTGHSIHDERPRWLADRMVAFLGNEGRGRPLAEAGWVHGHALEVEHLDRILEIIRVGSTGAVRGRGGQSTWLHLAVPTPVIADGRRLRAGSVLLRFRTDADDTRIRAVHVYDGENRIGALNGLAETSRG